jgi:2-phosphoglycerate kinase
MMKNNTENISITKASGDIVPFNKGKLKQSLLRSGANSEQADEVVSEVLEMLVEGMSTRKIYKTAFRHNGIRPIGFPF